MASRATRINPLDFGNYWLDRMGELFGSDFEQMLPETSTRGSHRIDLTRSNLISDTLEEAEEELLAEEQPVPLSASRKELRQVLRTFIPIDICELEKGYLVEANLPGIPKENISVHVDHNHVLVIETTKPAHSTIPDLAPTIQQWDHNGSSGSKQTPCADHPTPPDSPAKEKEEKQSEAVVGREGMEEELSVKKFLLGERYKGKLHRAIRLPKHANTEKVHSCVQNGVLCLYFQKLAAAETTRKIEVN